MKRSLLGMLVATSVLAFAASARAQSIEAIYGVGKVFDIPSATWMTFHVPGVEVSAKGFTFNVSHLIEAKTEDATLTFGGHSETDLTASYKYVVTERITISATAAKWFYHMQFADPTKQRSSDWRWFVETRYRLWEK